MKLTFIDKKDIPARNSYKGTRNLEILKEFADSDASAARVDDHGHKDVTNAAASINVSASVSV